ncbi:TM0106 family RecB-like putative nuclease (plasmid) [Acaryochloris sp. 'Moss Beach']|uniref:TM0106 family RecB-like putative nuclease n=1 Tax=Acaryochloris sp. 'Moss Beach' TaxID=2740837 RepID=UPI001F48FFFB|nr:TM0106 family RecB-like putative nuclease [Acaryochloris sp. 'Moss Beach']UJB73154.1 TM0106 family RecB-like putative nuclease [Acaryochloris sp. 'Moss Beach']
MQRSPTGPVYSPQDLIQFLTSDFACWMDRFALEHPESPPPEHEPDEMLQALVQLGQAHEQKFLTELLEQGANVFQVKDRTSFDETLAAMKAGHDYIYQAALKHENFIGYPDFLVRVEQPSLLGDWTYIPLECKLALNPKPDFIIQSACYLDLLHHVQGTRPQEFRLLLGNGTQESFSTEQYIYYFYQVRQNFLCRMADFNPQQKPLPGVGNHGRWQAIAQAHLLEIDHLSQVANVTQTQIRRLENAGIKTLEQLAAADSTQHIPKLDSAIFERLTLQAQLQKASAASEVIEYRLIPPDPEHPRRGLALLPLPSPLDVYFDMEGYPLVKGGLEYLFGAIYHDQDKLPFKDWWAHDARMEKESFESFIDWIYQRWLDDPSMHVYHYAPYETIAIKRLMQRYATREAQVDDLLRAEVFIDLYQVVRQSLQVGTTSYSIKYLEPLYGRTREESVKNAADSVVQYFQWLQAPDGDTPDTSQILQSIKDYNRVDCESTYELATWLRQLQQDANIEYQSKSDLETQTELPTDTEDPVVQLAEELVSELPEIPSKPDAQVQELLAHLLKFHERETKPFWWQRFTWLQMDEADLFDEPDCIAGLERTKTPPIAPSGRSKSWSYEYQFDPSQDLRIKTGQTWFAPEEPQKGCRLVELDTQTGRALISISQQQLDKTREERPHWEPPQRSSLIDANLISSKALPQSILDTVQQWRETGVLQPALKDLLYRLPPRIRNHSAPEIISGNTDLLTGTLAAVTHLDNSLLCIQGPPGSGKTYTAAHVITQLVQQGKSIAISANSHQAISNLMLKIAQMCQEQSIDLKGLKYGGEKDERILEAGLTWANNLKKITLSDYSIFGATAFQLCKPEMAEQWDYLFVDEAGQMALANFVAIARCTNNIVLMGDQMQLEQPIQATHPGESGQSVLGYYLDGKATIPPNMGIFLDTSYRMHPSICQFISEAIYENRLQFHTETHHHQIQVNQSHSNAIEQGNGILFVPVEHEGNSQHSTEEIQAIDALVEHLTGLPYISSRGESQGVIGPNDILVIAPYNLQVQYLKDHLCDLARVGTVDKFQGQEAPILILSMCASSSDTAPRGLEFLLNRNRLNVAISRAQCLSILVGSPLLASTACKNISDIELVNLYCKALHK